MRAEGGNNALDQSQCYPPHEEGRHAQAQAPVVEGRQRGPGRNARRRPGGPHRQCRREEGEAQERQIGKKRRHERRRFHESNPDAPEKPELDRKRPQPEIHRKPEQDPKPKPDIERKPDEDQRDEPEVRREPDQDPEVDRAPPK